MDTLALRLAAAGGRIDALPASQLVAAGFTLLQRSAPLVRLLAGRRAGILLPPGPAVVVALAASDGRAAVVLPLTASASEIADYCAIHAVGAVFTTEALLVSVPASLGIVLLDRAPRSALVRTPEGREQTVDLGSHVGLTIEGETDLPGRDEECMIIPSSPSVTLTHRTLLSVGDETSADAAAPQQVSVPATDVVLPLLAGRVVITAS